MPILSRKNNQSLYINTEFISGLQSLSFNSNTDLGLSLRINEGDLVYYNNGPIKGLISADILSNAQNILDIYTGNGSFSGKIEYGDRFFDFKSGFLNNYTINYNVNSPIRTTINATVYGSFSENTGLANNININTSRNLEIYDVNYVELNLQEASGNPVENFSISIDTTRYENYHIGNFYPTEVGILYPIRIAYSFDFYVRDLNVFKNYSYYSGFDLRDLTLNFYKNKQNTAIKSLRFSGIKLDSERIDLTTNENGRLSLNFSTFILSGGI